MTLEISNNIAPSMKAYLVLTDPNVSKLARSICRESKTQLLELSGQVTAEELADAVHLDFALDVCEAWLDELVSSDDGPQSENRPMDDPTCREA